MRPYLQKLILLASGALYVLGFAPFDRISGGWNGWLPLISLACLFLYLERSPSPGRGFRRGWFFGLGLFGLGVSWVYNSIHVYGAAPMPLAAGLTLVFCMGLALFTGLLGYIHVQLRQDARPWLNACIFAGLWTLQEYLRSWIFTGFPWLLAGNAHTDTPLAPLAPVIGVYGLSLLTALLASHLALLLSYRRKAFVVPAAVLVAMVWTTLLLYRDEPWTQPGARFSTLMVQGNIPQDARWSGDRVQHIVSTHWGLTLDALASTTPDLVIWPENAIPTLMNPARPAAALAFISAELRQLPQPASLFTGLPLIAPNGSRYENYYNGVMLTGAAEGFYFKQKLVPFGEYVPLDALLRGLIAFFDMPMSAFSRGSADQPSLLIPVGEQTVVLSPAICYEIAYPEFVSRRARETGVLVTVSNDTWFGTTFGPEQHLQIARMRALETGRWVLRATNDGYTAFINPQGQVVRQAPRFEATWLSHEVEARQGSTPRMVTGPWPPLLLGLLPVCAALLLRRRQQPVRSRY